MPLFCTTNPAWSGLESSPGLLRQKPATNRLSYGNVLKIEIHLNYIKKFTFYCSQNTWPLHSSFQLSNLLPGNNSLCLTVYMGRDSSVGIATRYEMDS